MAFTVDRFQSFQWWTKRQRELALKVHAGCVVTPYELILDHLVRREVNHCKRPRLSASPPGESPEVVEKDNMRRRPLWRLAYSAGRPGLSSLVVVIFSGDRSAIVGWVEAAPGSWVEEREKEGHTDVFNSTDLQGISGSACKKLPDGVLIESTSKPWKAAGLAVTWFLWSVIVEGQGLLHAFLEGPANWYELVGLGRAEWVLEGGREERRKEGGGRKEGRKKGGREGGHGMKEGGKERMKEGREQRRNKGGRARERRGQRARGRKGSSRKERWKEGRMGGTEGGREEGKTGREGKKRG
ncbi:Octapeptide-repeat protein T2, partial [Ophiophagus hannah]